MYCKNCGNLIDDRAMICPRCGIAQNNYYAGPTVDPNDAPNAGFSVLGFFFPLIGLILYLVWQSTSPLKAKSCGKGALIGFIVGVVSGIIVGIFYAVFLAAFIGAAGGMY